MIGRTGSAFMAALLLLVHSVSLHALEHRDRNISLIPEPPPKSEIFGITFGQSSHTVTERLIQMGLKIKDQKSIDSVENARLVTFDGTPPHLPVRSATSELLFINDSLVRMDFYFPPTYQNFLVVRNKLFSSLGNRFEVADRKEVMDEMLRTRLAHLDRNKFGANSERAIRKALLAGSTFFFYNLKDRKRELNVIYSYNTALNDHGEPHPELRLHYSLKTALDEIKEKRYKKQKDQGSVLP